MGWNFFNIFGIFWEQEKRLTFENGGVRCSMVLNSNTYPLIFSEIISNDLFYLVDIYYHITKHEGARMNWHSMWEVWEWEGYFC